MRIAGIDISTSKVAVAVLDDAAGPSYFETRARGTRAADRFRSLWENFRNRMGELERCDLVCVEDITFTRGRKTELLLAKALGGVLAHLYDMDYHPLLFNNQTVKATFGVTGSAKADIVAFVEKLTGLTGLSEDAADAFLVAAHGRGLADRGEEARET